jgi:hypothetical protein
MLSKGVCVLSMGFGAGVQDEHAAGLTVLRVQQSWSMAVVWRGADGGSRRVARCRVPG